MPSLLRGLSIRRCSAMYRSSLPGHGLRSGGYMAAIKKQGQAQSAKIKVSMPLRNPAMLQAGLGRMVGGWDPNSCGDCNMSGRKARPT
jgi:hypothetical protein